MDPAKDPLLRGVPVLRHLPVEDAVGADKRLEGAISSRKSRSDLLLDLEGQPLDALDASVHFPHPEVGIPRYGLVWDVEHLDCIGEGPGVETVGIPHQRVRRIKVSHPSIQKCVP